MINVSLLIRTKILLMICCIPFMMNAQIIGITMETSNDVPDAMKNNGACPTGDEITPEYLETHEMELVELINKERRKNGVSPLKRVDNLTKASRYHAKDMADNDYFSHDSNTGCTTFDRIAAFYQYNSAGENIAAGFDTPNEVHDGFVNSPTHLQTMLNSAYREVGVGFYWNDVANGNSRWVENFGTISNVYPILINDEAIETDSKFVIIYCYGSDVYDEIRFKNDDGNWSDWTTFTTSDISWEIDQTVGDRTVHAEMRTFGGSSMTSASDVISYKGENVSTGFDPKDVNSIPKSREGYSLYPNPTNEAINIDAFSNVPEDLNIQIINSVGQIVKNENFSGNRTGKTVNINVKDYHNGVYFAKMSSSSGAKTLRFVINK